MLLEKALLASDTSQRERASRRAPSARAGEGDLANAHIAGDAVPGAGSLVILGSSLHVAMRPPLVSSGSRRGC